MKKKTAAFFCVLLLCAALSGCGSPGRQDADLRTCEQIADEVQQAAGFRELTDMTEKYMEKYLLVDAKHFDAWVMRRDASKATPEMVILLEVKEGGGSGRHQEAGAGIPGRTDQPVQRVPAGSGVHDGERPGAGERAQDRPDRISGPGKKRRRAGQRLAIKNRWPHRKSGVAII